jgi:hypothetical protein
MMIRALFLGLMLGCGSFAATAAKACAICISMPKDSVADAIIDADLVAILREDPARPFHYSVQRALFGTSAIAPPPPFLVDAVMRARLASHPQEGALATWTKTGGWLLHGHASVALEQVAEHALAVSDEWMGADGVQARFDFFARHHAASDPAVQELALIELARMPYSMLRTLQPGIDRSHVARRLFDARWLEWTPIYILILGQSDVHGDQEFVRRAAKAALARSGHGDLAAWVTAWIEVDGVLAIEAIRRDYLRGQGVSDTDLRAIAMAMAEHLAGGDPAVALQASRALQYAAALHPTVAGIAARALLGARDWSAANTIAAQLERGAIAEPADVFIVEAYLAAAQDAEETAEIAANVALQD